MSAALCVACGKHPTHWRGFCVNCARFLGFAGRAAIVENKSERRRAIERIQAHLSSVRTYGGGAQR